MTKNIRISDDAHERASRKKRPDESWGDLLHRLMDEAEGALVSRLDDEEVERLANGAADEVERRLTGEA